MAHPAKGCRITWLMDGYGGGCRAGSQQPCGWILTLAHPRLSILYGIMALLTINPQTPAWPIDRFRPIRHLVLAKLHSISSPATPSRSYPWRGEGRGRRQCTASMRLTLCSTSHLERCHARDGNNARMERRHMRRSYYRAGCPPNADGESKTSRAKVNWDISQKSRQVPVRRLVLQLRRWGDGRGTSF